MKQESDDSMPNAYDDNKKAKQKVKDEGFEDEIVESDIEFEGEVIEPDNDPPQKVFAKMARLSLLTYTSFI